MSEKRHILIHGPRQCGGFFISDNQNNVWDGDSWRGFGPGRLYKTFSDAFLDRRKAQAMLRTRFTRVVVVAPAKQEA